MGLKPGYKTTEFLVVILANVGLLAATLSDNLPSKYAAFASAVSVAAYTLSRGLAKLNPPKDQTPSPPTTVAP